MSHGTTSTLTPALLKRIMELRSEGQGYRGIVDACRSEGYKVSISDITNWRKHNEHAGKVSFRECWEGAEEARRDAAAVVVDGMIKDLVEIADKEFEPGVGTSLAKREDARKTRSQRIKARVHTINAILNRQARMDGLQRIHLSGEVAGSHTLIVPRSKLFGEIDEDEQGDA